MPITHPYLSAYPNFRLLDKNGEDVDDFSFSKNEDNSSLVIGFTPSESPNRFTFKLGGSFSESSDGAVSQPISFNLAYGRPLTRLDHLQAWWDFDDENPEVVSEYFGRFPGAFIDNNISGTFMKSPTLPAYLVLPSVSPVMPGFGRLHLPVAWVFHRTAPERFLFGYRPRKTK